MRYFHGGCDDPLLEQIKQRITLRLQHTPALALDVNREVPQLFLTQIGDGLIPLVDPQTATLETNGIKASVQTQSLVRKSVQLMELLINRPTESIPMETVYNLDS